MFFITLFTNGILITLTFNPCFVKTNQIISSVGYEFVPYHENNPNTFDSGLFGLGSFNRKHFGFSHPGFPPQFDHPPFDHHGSSGQNLYPVAPDQNIYHGHRPWFGQNPRPHYSERPHWNLDTGQAFPSHGYHHSPQPHAPYFQDNQYGHFNHPDPWFGRPPNSGHSPLRPNGAPNFKPWLENSDHDKFPGQHEMFESPGQGSWQNQIPTQTSTSSWQNQIPTLTSTPSWQNTSPQGTNSVDLNNKPQVDSGSNTQPDDSSNFNNTNNDEDDNADDDEPVAVLGRPVLVSAVSPPIDGIKFNNNSTDPVQTQCAQDCPTTTEYAPVCGTNKITYYNPGRFKCARDCGVNVFIAHQGKCKKRVVSTGLRNSNKNKTN
ncbi:uncharacterized protein LOC105389939 isoform X1 [Plutella xylostella]|uniref:uncharacterized protein LOC105389939 isoform X1 n=1 Tax=Plutella xylostella TaxID=51655 RepID=UPI0020322898|nr:uncharacterized protein LOC105389939 isoform X1 [Plutella xylostella]